MATKSAQKSTQENTAEKSAKKIANFRKLAQQRTNAALAKIGKLKALANPRSYTYSDDEAAKVVNALKAAVIGVEKAFASRKAETEQEFTL